MRPSTARSKSEPTLLSIVVCWSALAEISSKPRSYTCDSTSKSKRTAISTVRVCAQIEEPPSLWTAIPSSSPHLPFPLRCSNTTHHQNTPPTIVSKTHIPPSTLDSPPFYSNPSSTRPSSTQYHAQAAEPYDPRSFTFDPTHVQPMHKPLSESVPPQFTASPFTPALSQSSPQHVQLGFVNLASHPHVHKPKTNAAHRTTAISPPPLTAPSPSPRSAGGSHGHGSIPSHTNTSTSGTQTCTASTPTPAPAAAAASSWRSRHKFGQRPSSP